MQVDFFVHIKCAYFSSNLSIKISLISENAKPELTALLHLDISTENYCAFLGKHKAHVYHYDIQALSHTYTVIVYLYKRSCD